VWKRPARSYVSSLSTSRAVIVLDFRTERATLGFTIMTLPLKIKSPDGSPRPGATRLLIAATECAFLLWKLRCKDSWTKTRISAHSVTFDRGLLCCAVRVLPFLILQTTRRVLICLILLSGFGITGMSTISKRNLSVRTSSIVDVFFLICDTGLSSSGYEVIKTL